jgi:sulfatase maturation enzyme AslB (radical SAM superfamily)
MTFKDNFCASPWFHTRLRSDGTYSYCRWAAKNDNQPMGSIQTESPIVWFQQGMKDIRVSMLQGQLPTSCVECQQMEQHTKVSGRQKQLLKIGTNIDRFEKSLLSSPWLDEFEKSLNTHGRTEQWPQDWQIDLGNYCNSACIFCSPEYSSRLATEYKKIGFIQQLPPRAWCDNPALLDIFLQTIEQSPKIVYLHFIGGETLITPAFRTILEKLVGTGLADKITIGLTTNLTVWDQSMVSLLTKFSQVNLGASIECFHSVNDYVRYGSNIEQVQEILDKWIKVARAHDWMIQLRTTPTVFSIWHLDTVYEFASENNIAVESCNFLNEPAFMRPSVLPEHWRSLVISKLQRWLENQPDTDPMTVINTRNPWFAQQYLVNDARSYIDYLQNQPDESFRLPELTHYLQIMENHRGNRILDYLPEYEQLLRSFGY